MHNSGQLNPGNLVSLVDIMQRYQMINIGSKTSLSLSTRSSSTGFGNFLLSVDCDVYILILITEE
jgi:hypothetical protein